MFNISYSLFIFYFRYSSYFFFCNFSFSFNFFIFYTYALFSSPTFYLSNILYKFYSFYFIILFYYCYALKSSSLFLNSYDNPFSLLSPTVLYIIFSLPPPNDPIYKGIFPYNIAFSLLIYSFISLNNVSLGSSLILGLFLMNLALLAYLRVLKVSS